MKKIISTICVFSMLTGAACADEPVTADLSTPIRWYAEALSFAAKYIFYNPEDVSSKDRDDDSSIDILTGETVSNAYNFVAELKKQTNSDSNEIITASPADIIGACKKYYNSFSNTDYKCAKLVLDAIKQHNIIALMNKEHLQGSFKSIADKSKPDIELYWSAEELKNALDAYDGPSYAMEYLKYFTKRQSRGGGRNASIDTLLDQCEKYAADYELEDINSICQIYIDKLIEVHNRNAEINNNEVKQKLLDEEQPIPQIEGLLKKNK